MKPLLDKMMDTVIGSLSGDARSFYDKEFDFFHEVTSISGKLKPYIKKSKLEKKVSLHFYLPYCLPLYISRQKLTKKWPKFV